MMLLTIAVFMVITLINLFYNIVKCDNNQACFNPPNPQNPPSTIIVNFFKYMIGTHRILPGFLFTIEWKNIIRSLIISVYSAYMIVMLYRTKQIENYKNSNKTKKNKDDDNETDENENDEPIKTSTDPLILVIIIFIVLILILT